MEACSGKLRQEGAWQWQWQWAIRRQIPELVLKKLQRKLWLRFRPRHRKEKDGREVRNERRT
jgi:hypothetical protein